MENNKKIICKPVDEELMLYDESTGKIHFLNNTAKIIWEAFQAGKGVEEIEELIRKQFDSCESVDLRKHIVDTLNLFKNKII